MDTLTLSQLIADYHSISCQLLQAETKAGDYTYLFNATPSAENKAYYQEQFVKHQFEVHTLQARLQEIEALILTKNLPE